MNKSEKKLVNAEWSEFCHAHGDKTRSKFGYYESVEKAYSSNDDCELCAKEANEGNERAIRYLTGFAKFRMTA